VFDSRQVPLLTDDITPKKAANLIKMHKRFEISIKPFIQQVASNKSINPIFKASGKGKGYI
jgi:hypothetical protein